MVGSCSRCTPRPSVALSRVLGWRSTLSRLIRCSRSPSAVRGCAGVPARWELARSLDSAQPSRARLVRSAVGRIVRSRCACVLSVRSFGAWLLCSLRPCALALPAFPFVYARIYNSICTCSATFPFVNLLVFTLVKSAPCSIGALCRKVVRQWDFNPAAPVCAPEGAPEGAGVAPEGAGAPCPARGAPAAAPSPSFARLVRSLLRSPSCSRARYAPAACSRFARLAPSLLRSLQAPPAPALGIPLASARGSLTLARSRTRLRAGAPNARTTPAERAHSARCVRLRYNNVKSDRNICIFSHFSLPLHSQRPARCWMPRNTFLHG